MRKYFFVLAMAAAAAATADEPMDAGKQAARAKHAADIEYWTSKYDGADLASGQFRCEPPKVPTMSRTNRQIKAVDTAVANWKQCYNGFVQNLNDAMPPGKRIPAAVASLMTPAEMEQAKAHLDKVYARVAAEGKASSDKTLAAYDKWAKSTAAYVSQANSDAEQRNEEMDLLRAHEMRGASSTNGR